jgi:hypothetical protein
MLLQEASQRLGADHDAPAPSPPVRLQTLPDPTTDGGGMDLGRAIIFTGDVIKDIINNPSYLGKVMVDGELIDAKHPALVDEAT